MAASKQIYLIFNALSHAIVTTVKSSWLNVFCGEVGRLIGYCVNKRAASPSGTTCWCRDSHGKPRTPVYKATCKATAREFNAQLDGGRQLVRLQTRNGDAVRIAELHLP